MSYATASALQAALYDRLTGDVAVTGLVGTDIYDGIPAGTIPPLYLSLGEETVADRSDKDGPGARHDVTLTIVTQANGFATAKALAGAVSDALLATPLILSRGHLAGLWFRGATAKRVQKSGTRRIDLRFRAQIHDTL
ncbi:hypothetical protein PARPLA_02859 [Rhodobacteraceae bacterium THAF1]|uniref:DUF3168 domain-containing protein n=1 Tax=Palleronia sp. THAF1 TaxID=2587842 RepID=UPI000F4035CE|nr:DUF3168 domain-containing protein [Palleronia sp. THAF1]QFU08261.1 hypothetical protein FIU81_06205 [Palleronia sp. THAF1]VDC28833.1 hypothetical protein PARPLA_02859 [Rhodobacteraceae bacterium THAF1]